MYQYYGGVFHELEKLSNCILYERKIINPSSKLDALILGRGWFGLNTFGKIPTLLETNVPKICYIFKAQKDLEKKLSFCKVNKIDVIITPLGVYKEYEKATGIRTILFKQSCNPNVFKFLNLPRRYDFGFSGALHNGKTYADTSECLDIRERVQNLVRKQKGLVTFLNGSDSIAPRLSYEEYVKKLNQTKIWLSAPSPSGDIVSRYYEAMMCKTLVFTSPIPKSYKDILRVGENCVEFSLDLSDFLDKLKYYLHNNKERERIVEQAYLEACSLHSYKRRAEELIVLIKDLKKRK